MNDSTTVHQDSGFNSKYGRFSANNFYKMRFTDLPRPHRYLEKAFATTDQAISRDYYTPSHHFSHPKYYQTSSNHESYFNYHSKDRFYPKR